MTGRRLALARLAGGFLPSLIARGAASTLARVSGIPDGAVLLRVSLGSDALSCTCFLEHPDFDPVPEGGLLPSLEIERSPDGGARMSARRLMIVRATPEFLASMCVEGATAQMRCVRGVPASAKLIGSAHDIDRNCFSVVFEDESFEQVQEGHEIPVLDVEFEDLRT